MMKWIKLFEEYSGNKNQYLVYHGTNNKFDIFDHSTIGSNTQASWNGAGFYFSDTIAEASLYGKHIMKCIITLNNPIDLTKVKDSSVQGSGIVKLFASINVLKDLKKEDYTYTQLNEIIDKEENLYDEKNIYFTEGSNPNFQHVWYEVGDKEYVLRNRTKDEIENMSHLKEMLISTVLYEKWNISDLPIRIKEACNPHTFSDIVSKQGYDGVIAYNSTTFNGHEYVVFSKENIKIN